MPVIHWSSIIVQLAYLQSLAGAQHGLHREYLRHWPKRLWRVGLQPYRVENLRDEAHGGVYEVVGRAREHNLPCLDDDLPPTQPDLKYPVCSLGT